MTERTDELEKSNEQQKKAQIADLKNHLGRKYVEEELGRQARILEGNILNDMNPENELPKFSQNNLWRAMLKTIKAIIKTPDEVI